MKLSSREACVGLTKQAICDIQQNVSEALLHLHLDASPPFSFLSFSLQTNVQYANQSIHQLSSQSINRYSTNQPINQPATQPPTNHPPTHQSITQSVAHAVGSQIFIPEISIRRPLLLMNALSSLLSTLQPDCCKGMDARCMCIPKAGQVEKKGRQDRNNWQTERRGLLGYMTSATAFLRPVSQHYITQVYISASTA